MAELLNPYSFGGSLSDPKGSGFFGREDVFDFVANSLQSARRPPIVLYGQRRIGKSSVLRQLPRHLQHDTVNVFFDLQGQARLPLDALLYGLAREIAGPCGLPRPTREQISAETFAEYLDSACTQLGSPRRLVLTFDEFDVIDVGANPNTAASSFLGFLATLVERAPQVGFVMVVGRKISELSEEFMGSILRNAVHHRLVRLTRTQSDALATQLGHGTLAFEAEALERLYRLAAGHPYCTQVLCNMLWQRLVRPQVTLPAPVGAADVEQALAPAVEYGTSGLSWIYDCLDAPSHRLFLAALAELQNEQADAPATMSAIEQRLLRYGAMIDAAELRTAPAKLANWDVVDGSPAGYCFAVPMIGLWIRINRPLVELEKETRLINPRAWGFYELAAMSQQGEQFEEAIALYQQALAANAVLTEAHLGLAACYRARNKAGDLERAIEAYERAHDLDADAPHAALVDALGQQIERSGHDPRLLVTAFKRIVTLEPDGPAAAHARRRLHHLARLRLLLARELPSAQILFEAIDDREGLQEVAREKVALQPYEQARDISMGVFFLGSALATSLTFMPLDQWLGWSAAILDWLRRIITGIITSALVIGSRVVERPPLWRIVLLAFITFGTTIAVAWYGVSLLLAWFTGFIVGGTAGVALVPDPEIPTELRPPPDTESERTLTNLLLRAAYMLQRFAQRHEKKP